MPNPEFENWFEPIGATGGKSILIGFPYSGSGVAMFAPWRRELDSCIDLWAAKMPGRESKLTETPRDDLLPLANELATIISEQIYKEQYESGLRRPVALAGFSLGGLLAFEVARTLQQNGVTIDLLIVGAARAPQGKWSRGNLRGLSDDRFLKKVHELYGAVPPSVMQNEELRQLLLPMLRADIKMYETYQFQSGPKLDCEIMTLSGSDDTMVQSKHIVAWRDMATRFRHKTFPAGHYFVRSHCSEVMSTINRRMERLIRQELG